MQSAIVDIDKLSFAVKYEYDKGHPGRMYLPNGDPGYPPEPASVSLVSISLHGHELTDYLDQHTLERIETKLLKNHEDDHE